MRIQALETIKHHPLYLDAGDIKTVDDETGQYCVSHGWAKDLETGEVGERQGGAVTLDPDSASHGVSSTEV